MGFVALLVLFFTVPLGLFGLGGTAPYSGQATPLPAPKIAPARGSATLSVKSMSPLVVVGQGFKPGESVRISGRGTKRARASNSGTFTVNLGGTADKCNGFTLVAVGSGGSRASLNFSQLLCSVQ